MTSAGPHPRPSVVVPSALLALLTVLGVLWMHSVSVMASPHEMTTPMSMATHVGHDEPHAAPCPDGHQMTHPCMGTTVSWPPLQVPVGVVVAAPLSDAVSARAMTVLGRVGRGPPWARSPLDESVSLRV